MPRNDRRESGLFIAGASGVAGGGGAWRPSHASSRRNMTGGLIDCQPLSRLGRLACSCPGRRSTQATGAIPAAADVACVARKPAARLRVGSCRTEGEITGGVDSSRTCWVRCVARAGAAGARDRPGWRGGVMTSGMIPAPLANPTTLILGRRELPGLSLSRTGRRDVRRPGLVQSSIRRVHRTFSGRGKPNRVPPAGRASGTDMPAVVLEETHPQRPDRSSSAARSRPIQAPATSIRSPIICSSE